MQLKLRTFVFVLIIFASCKPNPSIKNESAFSGESELDTSRNENYISDSNDDIDEEKNSDNYEEIIIYPNGIRQPLPASYIRNEINKLPVESLPKGAETIWFASSFLHGITLPQMFQHYLNYRTPVYLETVAQFRSKNPQFSLQEAEAFISVCKRKYQQYLSGEFDASDVNTLPATDFFKAYDARSYRTTLATEEEAQALKDAEIIEKMRNRNLYH